MNVIRQLVFSQETGWVPVGLLKKVLKESGFSVDYGEREDKTDGEEHWFVKWESVEFELHANRWVSETFIPLIDWLENLVDPISEFKNKARKLA
jgi:hypothetical protein